MSDKTKCKHSWKIFSDVELRNAGFLTFYCKKCLSFVKRTKEYSEEKL